MSKRTEILIFVKKQLEDADLFDGEIFTSQARAYDLLELPCVLVLIPSELVEVFSDSPMLELKKKAELKLQLIAEHSDGSESEIHDVLSQIEHTLLADDSMGGLISRVHPESLEVESFMKGERPIISGCLKFEVSYFERMERPETLPTIEQVDLNMRSYAV